MRKSEHFSTLKRRAALAWCLLAWCVLAMSISGSNAAEVDAPAVAPVGPSEDAMNDPSSEESSSSRAPLQGKTEHAEYLLEENMLYQHAMKAMEKKDYASGLRYLEMLTPEFDKEGCEPLQGQISFYQAECHKNLKRMRAAMDKFNQAYELFAKHDSSNPLKGKAYQEYEYLKVMQARMDSANPLQGGIQQSSLYGEADKHRISLVKGTPQFDINPNATLEIPVDANSILLQVQEDDVIPKIVKECFADMTCLETAEIGSNVTNADRRWVPIKVSGATAALAMDGRQNPAFRAIVNGRSYRFFVVLPGLRPGPRKILLVTDSEKICAVDVENMDTWLLRMGRAPDGRVVSAKWYKLEHDKSLLEKNKRILEQQRNRRNW